MSGEGRRGLRPHHSHCSAHWALWTRPVPVTPVAHGSGHEACPHCIESNVYNVPCAGSSGWGQKELASLLLRRQSGIWPKLRRQVQVLAESSSKIVPGDWNPPLRMTYPWDGVSFLLLFGLRAVFLRDLSSQLRENDVLSDAQQCADWSSVSTSSLLNIPKTIYIFSVFEIWVCPNRCLNIHPAVGCVLGGFNFSSSYCVMFICMCERSSWDACHVCWIWAKLKSPQSQFDAWNWANVLSAKTQL